MEPNRACPCVTGYISQELWWRYPAPSLHQHTWIRKWWLLYSMSRSLGPRMHSVLLAGTRRPDHMDLGMPDHRDHPARSTQNQPWLAPALGLPSSLRWPSLTFLAVDLSHLSKSHIIADAQAHFAVCCSQNTRDSSHITTQVHKTSTRLPVAILPTFFILHGSRQQKELYLNVCPTSTGYCWGRSHTSRWQKKCEKQSYLPFKKSNFHKIMLYQVFVQHIPLSFSCSFFSYFLFNKRKHSLLSME